MSGLPENDGPKLIEDFLRERLGDVADTAAWHIKDDKVKDEVLRLVENQLLVIDWHQNWPVLVEGEPAFEVSDNDPNTFVYKVSQQIQWLTQQEYIKRFGKEPPTAPLLRQMAAKYSWHPDYQTDWEI